MGLDLPRQGQVFDDGGAHGAVAADALVGGAAKQQRLAHGRGQGRESQPVAQRQGREAVDDPREEGHDELLAQRFHLLARETAQQVSPFADERRGEGAQRLGLVVGVGVGEEEQFAVGLGRQLGAGPVLAPPARLQRPAGQHAQPGVGRRQSRQDAARAVGRFVIQHQHLEIGVILGQKRRHAALDVGFLVAGGHEDGDARQMGRGLSLIHI